MMKVRSIGEGKSQMKYILELTAVEYEDLVGLIDEDSKWAWDEEGTGNLYADRWWALKARIDSLEPQEESKVK
jgi:hypothetical protein